MVGTIRVVAVAQAVVHSAEIPNSGERGYGFRPGKSQHNALDAVSVGLQKRKVNWILDADIQGFFDNISHERLLAALEIRIGDRRVLALIQKWLMAGVSEEGEWQPAPVGTPQGAVFSPFLANVYLHYVLDQRITDWRLSFALGMTSRVVWGRGFKIQNGWCVLRACMSAVTIFES